MSYRDGPLSVGRAGRVHGGDRLPWVEDDDNFAPLDSLAWQVHVYGDAAPEIEAACRERRLALHVFPWRSATRRTGLRRDALYLVRPDGYVALADPEARQAREQFAQHEVPPPPPFPIGQAGLRVRHHGKRLTVRHPQG